MRKRRYIIRKFIMATSAREAIKRDKDCVVDEVFTDMEWMYEDDKRPIGFNNKKK